MSNSFDTIVIGGGIAGLACAHRLVRALGPDKVRLLETSDRLGGHVRTTRESGYQLDWGPNGFLDRDPKMFDWIRELGLEGELVQADEASARRFLMLNGRLVEIVGPPKFLLSPVLSIGGRARLLMEPFIAAKRDDAPESVYDFAARRIGREAADKLVSAMVLGIFGGDARQLSLEHCFPRMAAMEREHGSLFRAMLAKRRESKAGASSREVGRPQGVAPTAVDAGVNVDSIRDPVGAAPRGRPGPMGPGRMLTSLRGGIGRLAERAAEVLGDVAKLHTSVARISRDAGEFEVRFAESGHGTARSFQSSRARNVVLAVPAYVAVEIVRELAPGAADRLASIDYASIAVVCTAHAWQDVRHDLNGFGYLIPPMERRETLGCLWTSSIFPGSAPDDRVLFRTMIGGSHHPDAVDRSDEELLAIIRRDVFDLLGVEGGPELVRIFRHRRAIPQYGLDHGDVLAAAEAAERAHPGLYFTGSAFRGVAMIDCAVDGFRVADRIIDSASPA